MKIEKFLIISLTITYFFLSILTIKEYVGYSYDVHREQITDHFNRDANNLFLRRQEHYNFLFSMVVVLVFFGSFVFGYRLLILSSLKNEA